MDSLGREIRVPCAVDPEVRQLTNKAATPISGEFEFLFACGLPYNIPNPHASASLAKDRKAPKNETILRRRISVKGKSRRLYKHEVFSDIMDLDILAQYDNLLHAQCGPSPFLVEPPERWEKMNSNVYRNPQTEAIYCRRITTGEFCIRIPKVMVVAEFIDDDMVKSVTDEKSKMSTVPTFENPAFRHLYEKALKNKETESSSSVTRPQQLTPMTSFIDETPIQRAIRLAKAKYRNRDTDPSPSSSVTRPQQRPPMTSFIDETPIQRAKTKYRNRDTVPSPSSSVTPPQQLTPMTSFIDETPIQRALRLAKAKYRNRDTDPSPSSSVTRPQQLPPLTSFIDETPIQRTKAKYRNRDTDQSPSSSVTRPQQLPPITSFIDETPIERALRLAKAKYRNRDTGISDDTKPKTTTTPSPSIMNIFETMDQDEDADILNITVDEDMEWLA